VHEAACAAAQGEPGGGLKRKQQLRRGKEEGGLNPRIPASMKRRREAKKAVVHGTSEWSRTMDLWGKKLQDLAQQVERDDRKKEEKKRGLPGPTSNAG